MTLARIAAAGRQKAAEASDTSPEAPAPSKAHAAVLGAFTDALGHLEGAAGGLGWQARAMLGFVRQSEGMMRDALGRLPEESLRSYLLDLRGRIDGALAE